MERSGRKNRRLTKADRILILSALFLALLFFLLRLFTRSRGAVLQVTVDQELYGTYALAEDRLVTITHPDGTVNEFEIRDGSVSMIRADCPDQTCVHMPKIRYEGETILCLPHRVLLQVKGGTPSGVDIR